MFMQMVRLCIRPSYSLIGTSTHSTIANFSKQYLCTLDLSFTLYSLSFNYIIFTQIALPKTLSESLYMYRWCASYVIAAMLVEFNKGFSLSASIISSNMAKISLSFEYNGIGCTPPIYICHPKGFQ